MKVENPRLIYRTIKKIPTAEIPEHLENSEFLTKKQMQELFSKSLSIEERMDGKLIAFAGKNFIAFCKDMYLRQNVFYKLPARLVLIDVFDKKNRLFLGREEKREIAADLKKGIAKIHSLNSGNFFLVPEIEKGKFTIEMLADLLNNVISAYAYSKIDYMNTYMHGIVARPYSNYQDIEGICGELLRIENCKGIDFNALRAKQERNEINGNIEEAPDYSVRAP